MPVSVATTTAPAPHAAPAAGVAPCPGDPICVAFAGAADGFRHAGTRSVAVDLVPLLAAATAAPLAA